MKRVAAAALSLAVAVLALSCGQRGKKGPAGGPQPGELPPGAVLVSSYQPGYPAPSFVPLQPMPIGVQIIAAPWREDIALRVALALEKMGAVAAPPARGI